MSEPERCVACGASVCDCAQLSPPRMVSLPAGAVGKISVEVEPSVDVIIQPDGSIIVVRAEWRHMAVVTRYSELYEISQEIGVAKLADALAEYGYLDEVER